MRRPVTPLQANLLPACAPRRWCAAGWMLVMVWITELIDLLRAVS
jgi:hypothetical protein